MTDTELQLLALHKAPVVPLMTISKSYFNLSEDKALRAASLNTLPVPAFRLTNSQKAPWMVTIKDLAQHIDNSRTLAQASWENAQVSV